MVKGEVRKRVGSKGEDPKVEPQGREGRKVDYYPSLMSTRGCKVEGLIVNHVITRRASRAILLPSADQENPRLSFG